MTAGPTLAGQYREIIGPEDFEDMDVEAQAMLAQVSWGEPCMTTSRDQSTGGDDAVVKAAVFFSVTEEAIAKATGV